MYQDFEGEAKAISAIIGEIKQALRTGKSFAESSMVKDLPDKDLWDIYAGLAIWLGSFRWARLRHGAKFYIRDADLKVSVQTILAVIEKRVDDGTWSEDFRFHEGRPVASYHTASQLIKVGTKRPSKFYTNNFMTDAWDMCSQWIFLAGVISPLPILAWQFWKYLNSGIWVQISILDFLDNFGLLTQWIVQPESWIGMHDILAYLHGGVASLLSLIMLSITMLILRD